MKAWRFYGFDDMRLDDVPDPTYGPDDVLLKIRVVEPSVTEAILAAGRETIGAPRIRKRLEDAPVQLFGHEFCAEVLEVGGNVRGFRPGDRVADRALLPCLTCALCLDGRAEECRRGPVIGFDMPGCFAEYAALPYYALVRLPDEVSDYDAAGLQPAAECVAAIDTAGVERNDTVAVIGQGAMGIHSTQAARSTLAGQVIAIDVRPEPLAMAAALGADHCINAGEVDPVEAVLELTDGRGADIVVESAGGPPKEGLSGSATVDQALAMVRDSGRVVMNSQIPGLTGIDLVRWRQKSLKMIFPMMADLGHLETTVRMIASGKLKIDPLVSHVVWGLEQTPLAIEITGDKGRFGATGPAQIVVDTDNVPRHPRIFEPAATV
jgi:threonine dehydrogenase-like Zn-dependent dehydrogenase